MADLSVDFCGIKFKNPIVVSSIEPTNSLDKLKRCVDAGAAGAVVKTLTDTPQMAVLTHHSKYAILNDNGRPIRGKYHVILSSIPDRDTRRLRTMTGSRTLKKPRNMRNRTERT